MAREAAVPIDLAGEAPTHLGTGRRLVQLARRHPLGVFGLLCVAVFIICGIFANVIAPYSPYSPNRQVSNVATLTDGVDAKETEWTLSANQEITIGSTLFVDNEQVSVLLVKGASNGPTDVSVMRAAGSSEAAAHSAGAVVRRESVEKLEAPSARHPFGTDKLGRDVMSRTVYGARISLFIGLVAVFIGTVAGTFLGILSGYFGKLIDSLIQRTVDVLLAFPPIILLLVIVTVIGDEQSSFRKFLADYTPIPQDSFLGIPFFLQIFILSIGIAVVVAVGTTRIVRGTVLSVKENVYIEAARALGAPSSRIMWRHIFPNVAALVVVLASVSLPIAILAEAAISFLGIGVPIPTPSWGADVTGTNRDDALRGAWWVVFFPGLALSLVVLGFNMLGDAFRDISDPRLRGSGLGGGGGGGSRGL